MQGSSSGEINSIVQNFAGQLTAVIERSVADRVRAVLGAIGAPVRRGPGRPPKNAFAFPAAPAPGVAARPRKKRAKQLCPVPGCKNAAAPVFGMVCAKHKDLPKAKIREFREARRKAKAGGAPRAKRGRKRN